MRLSSLTKNLPVVARHSAQDDPLITMIASDSRESGPGSLFVALRGGQMDGHDFARDAVARGARALIVDRPVPGLDVPIVVVDDTRKALAHVASAFYRNPAQDLDLIGVTGSVGKTSTTLMLKYILEEAGEEVGVIGSLGIFGKDTSAETSHTTPDAVTLQRALHELRSSGTRTVVMEVSSHALAQERTHGLEFETCVFTNLLPMEHQEYHPTFEDYARTKAKLLTQVKRDGPVVFNHDDAQVSELISGYRGPKLSFGFEAGAAVRASGVATGRHGCTFDVHCPNSPAPCTIHLPLLGVHNVSNALAAATAALARGADLHLVRESLQRIRPFRRRMEVLQMGEYTVIDDTVGHPESIDRLFTCLSELEFPSIVLVAAVRGKRGREINVANARKIADWCRRLPVRELWVTTSQDVTGHLDEVLPDEAAGFMDALQAAGTPYRFAPHLEEACRNVAGYATRRDVIVLAGAQGMDAGADFLRRNLR